MADGHGSLLAAALYDVHIAIHRVDVGVNIGVGADSVVLRVNNHHTLDGAGQVNVFIAASTPWRPLIRRRTLGMVRKLLA